MADLTPSQTIGPFFHQGLAWAIDATRPIADSGFVRVAGRVLDGAGEPVMDALLEVWQSEVQAVGAAGLPGFQRVATDEAGRFEFRVMAMPAAVAMARVTVFARGLLRELFTRVYVRDPQSTGPVGIPPEVAIERAETLIARPPPTGMSGGVWTWDVVLQGPAETVFFDF